MTIQSLTSPILHKIANLTLRTRIFGLIFISLVSTAFMAGGSVYVLHRLGMEIRMLVETNLPISNTLASIEVHRLDHSLLLIKDHAEHKIDKDMADHMDAIRNFFNFLDEVDRDLTKSSIMAEDAVKKVTSPVYHVYFKEVARQLSILMPK